MKKTAKLLIAFILVLPMYGQNQFKLYKATFRSAEILGAGDFGPNEQDHQTAFIKNVKNTNELFDILGQYYHIANFNATSNLLNKYSQSPLPVLDEINLKFYHDNGFDLLTTGKPELESDQNFIEYRTEFYKYYENKNFIGLRKFVYDPNNKKMRIMLEKTKYVSPPPVVRTFNLKQEQTKETKIGIEAQIKAIVNNYLNITGDIKVKFENIIKSQLVIKDATYYEIAFNPDFIDIASLVVKKYESDKALLEKNDDVFSKELLGFLNSNDTAIITGAAILEISVNYEKYQKLVTDVGILASAEGKISSEKNIELKAKLDALFKSTTEREFSITTGRIFYNIRYGYSDKLEIGNIRK